MRDTLAGRTRRRVSPRTALLVVAPVLALSYGVVAAQAVPTREYTSSFVVRHLAAHGSDPTTCGSFTRTLEVATTDDGCRLSLAVREESSTDGGRLVEWRIPFDREQPSITVGERADCGGAVGVVVAFTAPIVERRVRASRDEPEGPREDVDSVTFFVDDRRQAERLARALRYLGDICATTPAE
jgi:hypothetical protein